MIRIIALLLFSGLSFFNPVYQVLANDEVINGAEEQGELKLLKKEVAELRAIIQKMMEEQAKNKAEFKKITQEQVENKAKVKKLKEVQENNNTETEIAEINPIPDSDFQIPSINIRGFGHVQYDYAKQSFNNDLPDKDRNHFANGNLGLLFFSQLAEELSFLNETVFRFDEQGDSVLSVERLMLKYEYADWLNISIGRNHTPLGYWNQAYHHARWTQTTTDRPLIHTFENNGGILPLHHVGIEFMGNLGFKFGDVNYSLMVANGRGKVSNSVQLIEDLNESKQVALNLTVKPSIWKGFGIGGSALYDVIPENLDVVGRENEIEEIIAGVHMYYKRDPYELIAEYQYIRHDDSRSIKQHHGGFVQLAYTIDKFKPYYRYDVIDIASNDSYFDITMATTAQDSIQHTAGLRYEWFPFAALKLEYRWLDTERIDSHAFTSQISFMY